MKTREYRTLDGSQGLLVEYRAHGKVTVTTEEKVFCIVARDTMMWTGAARDVMMWTHMCERGRVQ